MNDLNQKHSNQANKSISLPKPMIALIIATLATSPAFISGCSSTQTKPSSEPLAYEFENTNKDQPVALTTEVQENEIEEINQHIATIDSETIQVEEQEQVSDTPNVLDEIKNPIEESIDHLNEDLLSSAEERPAKIIFNFGFNQQEAATNDIEIIEQHGRFLSEHPDKKIQIHGHADSQGNPLYNEHLAKQRAKYIADLIVQQGASQEQVEIISWGSDKPVENATHWKDHRRVELIYEDEFLVSAPANSEESSL